MDKPIYRTTPDPKRTTFPPGIKYIIGNELAERFSFYGMRSVLTIFMTRHLLDAAGQPDNMSDERAKAIFHLFTAGVYFFPIIGALISDIVLGKYRTILFISLMYCLGHGCLALMDLGPATGLWDMQPFLYAGLILIAMGAGGIKPCVSAHVGDQFGTGNKHLLTKTFNWFYFSINLGAAASTLLIPILLERPGPWLAFGLPGVLMAIATFLFWLGRGTFIHVPPSGAKEFARETFSPEGLRALRHLSPLFLLFVPVFWAIFDQTGSAWVLQAESMDRDFVGVTWLESQVQAVNPLLILVLIPTFTYVVYPAMGRFFEPTPLRKIGIGLLLTAVAFSVSALIEAQITQDGGEPADALWAAILQSDDVPDSVAQIVPTAEQLGWEASRLDEYRKLAERGTESDKVAAVTFWQQIKDEGQRPERLVGVVRAARALNWDQQRIGPFLDNMPNIGWQFLAYLVLTSAEILVSIVCLEFAYTQSPPRMKSFIMGVFFLGVSLGNLVVSGLNYVLDDMKDETGRTPLDGATYYWFFAGLMLVTFAGYVLFAMTYKGETFIQGEGPDADAIHAEAEAEGPDTR